MKLTGVFLTILSATCISGLSASQITATEHEQKIACSEEGLQRHRRSCCQKATETLKTGLGKVITVIQSIPSRRRLQAAFCCNACCALWFLSSLPEGFSDTVCSFDPCCVTDSTRFGSILSTGFETLQTGYFAKSAYGIVQASKELREDERTLAELQQKLRSLQQQVETLRKTTTNLQVTLAQAPTAPTVTLTEESAPIALSAEDKKKQ